MFAKDFPEYGCIIFEKFLETFFLNLRLCDGEDIGKVFVIFFYKKNIVSISHLKISLI